MEVPTRGQAKIWRGMAYPGPFRIANGYLGHEEMWAAQVGLFSRKIMTRDWDKVARRP